MRLNILRRVLTQWVQRSSPVGNLATKLLFRPSVDTFLLEKGEILALQNWSSFGDNVNPGVTNPSSSFVVVDIFQPETSRRARLLPAVQGCCEADSVATQGALTNPGRSIYGL